MISHFFFNRGVFMNLLKKILVTLLAFFSPLVHAQTETLAMKQSIVVFETNIGTIELTLMPDIAPKACENFLGLVQKHYYDGLIFHRIIKNFMIQGGDPTGT